MNNCVICGKDSESECCSGACRAKKSRRTQERTVKAHAAKGIIVDACGKSHKIDYEGRRKTHDMLESWRRGEGTEYQRRIGQLSADYTLIKGIDLDSHLGRTHVA